MAVEQGLANHKPFGEGFLHPRAGRKSAHRIASPACAGTRRGARPAGRVAQPSRRSPPAVRRDDATLGDRRTLMRLASDAPGKLPLNDCAAVLTAAARYVERGGTDTPLQDGTLVALGPKPHHGWIWRDEHGDDAYGRAFRHVVPELYGTAPSTPDADSIETLQVAEARLLEELLPSLAPSALHHAHIIACVPPSEPLIPASGSSSQLNLRGMVFLRESLGSPWWIAEHLLHESLHLKLYDLHHGHPLVHRDGGMDGAHPVITPWNPPRGSGANRWYVWRVLAAFHVSRGPGAFEHGGRTAGTGAASQLRAPVRLGGQPPGAGAGPIPGPPIESPVLGHTRTGRSGAGRLATPAPGHP